MRRSVSWTSGGSGGRTEAAALTKARERRRALDAARDEHDRLFEQATAESLAALEARREAE
jgi:hypothetical protein